MEEQLELEFQKLNLKENDVLVIKADLNGLSEEDAVKKLSELRNDDFVKHVESKGNKVIVSYTGIDFQILRTEPEDKIVVYTDVSKLNEQETSDYINVVKNNLSSAVTNEIVVIPISDAKASLRVEKGEENE